MKGCIRLFALILGVATLAATPLTHAGTWVPGVDHSFIYSGAVFSFINYPGASQTYVEAINNHGQLAGYYFDSSGRHGFVGDGGVFISIDYPVGIGTVLLDINDNGQFVGAYSDAASPFGYHSFLYSGGIFSSLEYPGASLTFASAINDIGQIVGYYIDGSGWHSFLYSGGVFSTINFPVVQPPNVFPSDINDSEQIVGAYNGGFLYEGGTFSTIGGTAINSINNSGQMVGWAFPDGGFLYSEGVFSNIEYPPVPGDPHTLWYVNPLSINDDGVIVGVVTHVMPEPTGLLLLGSGIWVVFLAATRRQLTRLVVNCLP